MTLVSHWRALIGAGLLLVSSCAFAQQPGDDVPAGINSPAYTQTDPNGVNLTSNKPTVSLGDVSIGEKTHPLSHMISSVYDQPSSPALGWTDSFAGRVQLANVAESQPCPTSGGAALDVILAGQADTMCSTVAGTWFSNRNGTSMTRNADGTLTYTNKDGTQFLFGLMSGANLGWLTQVTEPDGRTTTITYKIGNVGSATFRRVQSVARNDGLQMKYTYAANTTPASGYPTLWMRIASITALNNTIDYCDPQADACTYTQAWPTAVHSWTTNGSLKYFTVTDAGGQSTRFTIGIPTLTPGVAPGVAYAYQFVQFTSDQLLAVRSPTSTSADTVTYFFCAVWGEFKCMQGAVKKVVANGLDWLYPGTSGSGGPSTFIQISANRPAAIGGGWTTTTQVGNIAAGPLVSHYDGLTKRYFSFDSSRANRLAYVQTGQVGEGDILRYEYDQRGNITKETHTPKSGSPLQIREKIANYDTTCSNPLTCNRPNWIRDARGKQTDYAYDPQHGGALRVTSPADSAGIRPQVRYAYTQRFAWYKNSSGNVVQSPTPIWLLASKKICRKTPALPDGSGCSVPADEVTTTYEYGPTSGANNLFLRGVAVTADGVTRRACFAYDIYGNRISETLPKAGLSSCP